MPVMARLGTSAGYMYIVASDYCTPQSHSSSSSVGGMTPRKSGGDLYPFFEVPSAYVTDNPTRSDGYTWYGLAMPVTARYGSRCRAIHLITSYYYSVVLHNADNNGDNNYM